MRRRHRLQVSTFPFLAVLLCAMGSLILLLLVLDRRARVVARARALQTVSQATAQQEQAAAEHRAEWERRRQALHQQLAEEDEGVREQIASLDSRFRAAAEALQEAQRHPKQLQELLHTEQTRQTEWTRQLGMRRAEIAQSAEKAQLSQAEMARLSAELEQMERTLNDLKALRQRQQQTYSIVPYRGKHGDGRRPLYVECAADELIFYPEHSSLRRGKIRPEAVHEQIDRQQAQRASSTGKPPESAYVLLLVRPNGITTYYHTLEVLKALQMEFGYEFVDRDWVLDFPEDESATPQQSWMIAQKQDTAPGDSVATRKVKGLPAPQAEQPVDHRRGVVFNGERSAVVGGTSSGQGEGQGGQFPSSAVAGVPATGHWPTGAGDIPGRPGSVARLGGIGAPGTGRGDGIASDQAAGVADGLPVISARPGVKGTGGDLSPSPGTSDVASSATGRVPRTSEMGLAGRSGSLFPTGDGSVAKRDGSQPSIANSGQTGSSQLSPSGGASLGAPSALSSSGGRSSSSIQNKNEDSDLLNRTGANPQQIASNGTPGNAEIGSSKPGGSTAGNQGTGSDPTLLPGVVPHAGTGGGQGPSDSQSSESGTATPGSGQPAGSNEDHGSGRPAQADIVSGLGGQGANKREKRPAGLRPIVLTGNRDWVIPIECTGDDLILYSTAQRFSAVVRGDNGAAALAGTIRQLIENRQATVHPGEPAYRPMIRFRVRPDGLRAYYLAYPALEALGIPMTRENLEARDDPKAGGAGH